MRKQDHLLQLINTLSPNEKRYFKLFNNIQPGEKRYLNLFDALETKSEYDAQALSIELGISTKQLSDDKYYLSQALFQSLRNYAEENEPTTAIRHSYEEALLLTNRRLFEHALEVTDKALSRAWELELFELIGQLLQIKFSCLHGLERNYEMPPLLIEYKKATEAGAELFELNLLSGAISIAEFERLGARKFGGLSKMPLLRKNVKKLKSLGAQIRWFDIMFRYYIMLANAEKTLEMARLEVSHYEQNPGVKKINAIAYVVSYTRLANGESEMGNFESALKAIQKFELVLTEPALSLTQQRITSLKFYAMMFSAYLLSKLRRYDEALVINEECYNNRAGRPMYDQFSLIFDYAFSLYSLGKIHEAADKLEELLQMKEEVRFDLQQYVRPLMIMVQIDLGNYQLIPYLIKSAKAWMKRKKITNNFDPLFRSFSQLGKATSQRQRIAACAGLKKEIENGKLDFLEKDLHLSTWVNRKISELKAF